MGAFFSNLDNPTFYQELIVAVAIIALFALAGQLLSYLLGGILALVTRRTRTRVDDIIIGSTRGPLVAAVTLMGIGIAYGWQSLLLPGDWDRAIGHFLYIGYTILGFVIAYRLLGNLIDWYLHEKADDTVTTLDDQVLPFVRRLLAVIMAASAFIMILQDLGQPIGSLIATLGVGSLAVALAAEPILQDILSGFFIMSDRRFRVGDRIELVDEDLVGDVQDIGLRTTRVLTMDYRMVIVPNSLMVRNIIVNHAYPDPNLRLDVPIGVAYGVDIRQAKTVLLDAVRGIEGIHQLRQPDIVITGFGDNAINLEMRAWIPIFADKPKMTDRIYEASYQALNEAGIEIPFPQRTIWHRVEPQVIPLLHSVLDEQASSPASENGADALSTPGVPGDAERDTEPESSSSSSE